MDLERKRRLKKRTKWILLSILILLLVIFGLHRFYIFIQQDLWQGEKAAMERAKSEAGIVEVDQVWKSVWDEVCWVVEGKNEAGEDVVVWLLEGKEPTVKLLSEGVSESRILSIIHKDFPQVDIIRLVPGIYEGKEVWQLFYKEKAHHYYRFFSFSDGTPLSEVFTLPNR
ncbi:hypothetical protein D3C78_654990 [compost metagenome]